LSWKRTADKKVGGFLFDLQKLSKGFTLHQSHSGTSWDVVLWKGQNLRSRIETEIFSFMFTSTTKDLEGRLPWGPDFSKCIAQERLGLVLQLYIAIFT